MPPSRAAHAGVVNPRRGNIFDFQSHFSVPDHIGVMIESCSTANNEVLGEGMKMRSERKTKRFRKERRKTTKKTKTKKTIWMKARTKTTTLTNTSKTKSNPQTKKMKATWKRI